MSFTTSSSVLTASIEFDVVWNSVFLGGGRCLFRGGTFTNYRDAKSHKRTTSAPEVVTGGTRNSNSEPNIKITAARNAMMIADIQNSDGNIFISKFSN